MSAPRSAPPVALSPERALDDLAAASREPADVLVIGGGIVGAGVALDAATRGLTVVLVEAEDWASGTSSRSSKLVHGGLRYVQTRQLSLVREALRERALLLRLAPHLVRPIRFLYPLRRRIEGPYVGAGVALYGLLARVPGAPLALPRARYLGATAARRALSGMRPGRVRGAIAFSDAQVDDARLVLGVVRTAASYGAAVLTRTRVTGLVEEGGRVVGARAALENGEEVELRARVVISATGAWTEQLAEMAGAEDIHLAPSKGVHLVVGRDAIRSSTAVIVPTRASVLFILPWGAHWIIGTTDTPWRGEPGNPITTAADVDYLLDAVNAVLARPIGRDDVESVYVGVRPLLAGRSESTVKLSREHAVVQPCPGLTLVTGGKLTTYRVMAKDALDAALRASEIAADPCRTDAVAIVGAEGCEPPASARAELATRSGLAAGDIDRLLVRYGGLVTEVLAPVEDPEPFSALESAPGYLCAEVAYAVTHEGARHLEDVLERRLRVAMESADRGIDAAEEVAGVMAPLLGWSPARREEELVTYRGRVETARRAEQLPNDAAVVAAS